MLTSGTEIGNKKQPASSLLKDRVRGVGLGFERENNPDDAKMLAEVAKMKKKAQQSATNQSEKLLNSHKSAGDKFLKGAIDKKSSGDFRERLIAKKRETKQQRKDKKS